MGLDVSVYKNVKITEKESDYKFTAFVIDEDWKYKIKNLEDGKDYKGDYAEGDISYGYGMHSRFREKLLEIIGRKDLLIENGKIDWARLQDEKDMPFYELINFADNEGCLDFEISTILYKNFVEWKNEAVKHLANNEYFMGKYLDWINVFKSGKEPDSVVVFS